VKWYDAVKGFGFIVSKEVEGDVLIHRSVIQQFGCDRVLEGATVECDVVQKLRGLQARKVHSIDNETAVPVNGHAHGVNGTGKHNGRDRDIIVPEEVGPPFEAACKWFSRPKGFGFLIAMNGAASGDIFVHMDTLRRCNIRELRQHQRVIVRAAMTQRGLMAIEVQLGPGILPPSDFEH
jgi:CspA family cold shock protein